VASTLWPREHGAYGQITLPLATVWLLGTPTLPALALTMVVVAGFLAHEPLLVLAGARGARAGREQAGAATIWLVITVAVGLVAALIGVRTMSSGTRWSLALPLVPACVLAATTSLGKEKSVTGELAAALAFATASIPVGLAAGLSSMPAISAGAVFASIFASATLGVRVVILTVRAGGNPGAARLTRLAAILVSIGAACVMLWCAFSGIVSPAAPVAAMPGLLAGLVLAARPPSPTKLRRVGWTLVGASVSAAAVLIVGLR